MKISVTATVGLKGFHLAKKLLNCAPLGAPCDVKEATHPRVRY
jgi:hypothetical protein